MNRIPMSRPMAISIGSLLAALLSLNALAAEPGRLRSEAVPATFQQRLEAAQRGLERAAQEVAELSTSLSQSSAAAGGKARLRPQRAALGVNIGSDAVDGRRSEGVRVQSVIPGSGAYEAGLKSGDVLLTLNNKPLRLDDDGSPREKLLAMMRGVRPDEKVAVKYRRDGFTKTVDLIARPLRDRSFTAAEPAAPPAPSAPAAAVASAAAAAPTPIAGPARADSPRIAVRRLGGILAGAELVPLTPRLGQYFGTDQGLLVVRAPADESLDIQEGDVILEIDGRTPDSTAHAVRILRSYQPGEELTLSVYRRKRSFDIELVVPEDALQARREQRLDRARSNRPALRQLPRSNAVPPAAPAAEAPAAFEVQPLPDDEVEVEPAD